MNGVIYATVSGAARQLQGGGIVAGWHFWCVDPGFQRTMADVRADHAGGWWPISTPLEIAAWSRPDGSNCVGLATFATVLV